MLLFHNNERYLIVNGCEQKQLTNIVYRNYYILYHVNIRDNSDKKYTINTSSRQEHFQNVLTSSFFITFFMLFLEKKMCVNGKARIKPKSLKTIENIQNIWVLSDCIAFFLF